MLQRTTKETEKPEESLSLDELAREGARRTIQEALQAEVEDSIQRLREQRDEEGHALVGRNGQARARKVTLGSGTVEIAAPRAHDKREGYKFSSAILPPSIRRSPNVNTVLPLLYLWGLSTGDFAPALHDLLGAEASGLSPGSISRLTDLFPQEDLAFRKRDLSSTEDVYVWAGSKYENGVLVKEKSR